ncbi:MAG: ATPase, T2SS/T4P/T4SS family [Candidatus Margulisiibacteriota bacterium]|nr:ATPase, T2SS/T4P/T4SS family [Candidatus Margulisiibacteriota bacterium]
MVDRSRSLRESLVKSQILTEEQIKIAIEKGRKTGDTLIKSILSNRLVDENTLISFLEREMDIPRVDLSSYIIDQKALALVPYAVARKYRCLPLFKVGDILTVAMVDPFDVMALDEVRAKTKCEVEPMVATAEEIDSAINQYYGVSGSVADLVKGLEPEEKDVQGGMIAGLAEESPVAKLVTLLILRAVGEKASDVHIEPTSKDVRIRYRVDGIMHDVSSAPGYLNSSIVTRIKVMAKMDIAESRVPQDGRFELKSEGRAVDVRVSSFPTIHGECLVLRLLDKKSILLSLTDLGFSKENLIKFEELVKKPYGIILVTGPTGSGKTTTLYATLNHIVTPEKNIMTIEDPVEYELAGIRQTPINPKAGLDFANSLRSIVRQDPDVILVGEVRDLETAKVAIQSALTGHLVFSTLHTNDAAGTLTRLIEMGIEPFLCASSVDAAVAQRLVRNICTKCKEEYFPPKELIAKVGLDPDKDIKFYRGKGCKSCRGTGYAGRTGIYEFLLMDDAIRDLVLKRASSVDIKEAAMKAGMRTLRDDGLLKVLDGITTIEEVIRVTQLE